MNPAMLLQQAIHALQQYAQAEPDPADRQMAGQMIAALSRLAAKDRTDLQGQPQQHPMMGGQQPQGQPNPLAAILGRGH